jgi:hypothetical protein
VRLDRGRRVGRRQHGLAPRGVALADVAAGARAERPSRQVADDGDEPRARGDVVARRALQRGDARVLHDVVGGVRVAEQVERQRAHAVGVGGQFGGGEAARHRGQVPAERAVISTGRKR